MAKTDGVLSSANLRTVKELILDEQKLVTYVSLSKELCIHVNEAKTLLSQFVDEIKENKTNIQLNVSFIISGLTNINAGRTTVCLESDLKTQKENFKTVFFEHIYSVSQGSSCIDNAAIVSINRFNDFSLCAGLIKGSLCTKRSSDEIGSLITNSQKTVDEQKTSTPSRNEIKEKSKDVTQNAHKVVKVHETKSEPMVKSEVTSPKKDTSINGKSSAKNSIKPSKGIAGFFAKSNSAPSTKPTKVIKEAVQENTSKTETNLDVKKETQQEIKKEKEESMDVDEEIPVKKSNSKKHSSLNQETAGRNVKKEPESAKKSNSKKNSSLNQIKKNAKVDKKRKRVLHVSDSESEEDNDPFADEKPANNESDDEIPPTPSTNTVKITSGILNPKKRRKIVDKTYTDEEGYILTRKEEVYESCSDDEIDLKADVKPESENSVKPEKENIEKINKVKTEVSPKAKKTKNNKKKISPPQKGKQATLMTFFKKI